MPAALFVQPSLDHESTERWMSEALALAEEALRVGEVPVGCVIVLSSAKRKHSPDGEAGETELGGAPDGMESTVVIGRGRNRVNETKNATVHAEFVAIVEATEYCKQHALESADVFQRSSLYVTVEPCIMCADALHQFQFARIVYGCANERFGGIESVVKVFELPAAKSSEQNVDGNEQLAAGSSGSVLSAEVEPFYRQPEIISGIRKDEAIALLRQFYTAENPNAPEQKRRKKDKTPARKETQPN